MKFLALSLVLLLASANAGWAKTITVNGDSARSIMESLAASGFEIKNIDEEWSGKTLSVETSALTCHYTATNSPDGWMNNVHCYLGMDENGTLSESLALAKAIAPYAYQDAGLGNRWLMVEGIKCSLVYDAKAYECKIEAEENNE